MCKGLSKEEVLTQYDDIGSDLRQSVIPLITPPLPNNFFNISYKLKHSLNNMNYEMFGIVVTVVIVSSMMSIATAELADFDLPFIEEVKIAETPTVVESNTFYEWCYNMKIECS